jgi:hypothetical protein
VCFLQRATISSPVIPCPLDETHRRFASGIHDDTTTRRYDVNECHTSYRRSVVSSFEKPSAREA